MKDTLIKYMLSENESMMDFVTKGKEYLEKINLFLNDEEDRYVTEYITSNMRNELLKESSDMLFFIKQINYSTRNKNELRLISLTLDMIELIKNKDYKFINKLRDIIIQNKDIEYSKKILEEFKDEKDLKYLEGVVKYYEKDYEKALNILSESTKNDIVKMFLGSIYFKQKNYSKFREYILSIVSNSYYNNKCLLRVYIDILNNDLENSEIAKEYIDIATKKDSISILSDNIEDIYSEELESFLNKHREFLIGRILLVDNMMLKNKLQNGLKEIENTVGELKDKRYIKKNSYMKNLYIKKLAILERTKRKDELMECCGVVATLEDTEDMLRQLSEEIRAQIMNKKLERRRKLLCSVYTLNRMMNSGKYEEIVKLVESLEMSEEEMYEVREVTENYMEALHKLGEDEKLKNLKNKVEI